MNENIKIMLEKLSKDNAAQAKLQAATNPDEAYALVSSIQGGYTKEEFMDVMKKIASSMQEGELSDEDVSAAAGGIEMLSDPFDPLSPKQTYMGVNTQAAV
jgi:undecaprenyl pyrophosphate synthase